MATEPLVQAHYSGRAFDTTNCLGFKNILFATDFSLAAEKALQYTIEIARRYSAKLYAVHVASPPVSISAPDPRPQLAAENAILRLEAKALDRKLSPVAHEVIFTTGNVWETVSGISLEKQIDLLVLGTHGRTGIEKALMGSTAEEIFRQAACPVMTVGPHVSVKTRKVAQLSRVLYATDFSSESLAAAPYAISLAREHRAQLFLLHCIEEGGNLEIMLHTLRELVPFGADLRCEPTCVVERGPHEEKILAVAEGHGGDAIVLGVPAPNSKGRHFEHSALYKIVTQAVCPVLTIRA